MLLTLQQILQAILALTSPRMPRPKQTQSPTTWQKPGPAPMATHLQKPLLPMAPTATQRSKSARVSARPTPIASGMRSNLAKVPLAWPVIAPRWPRTVAMPTPAPKTAARPTEAANTCRSWWRAVTATPAPRATIATRGATANLAPRRAPAWAPAPPPSAAPAPAHPDTPAAIRPKPTAAPAANTRAGPAISARVANACPALCPNVMTANLARKTAAALWGAAFTPPPPLALRTPGAMGCRRFSARRLAAPSLGTSALGCSAGWSISRALSSRACRAAGASQAQHRP